MSPTLRSSRIAAGLFTIPAVSFSEWEPPELPRQCLRFHNQPLTGWILRALCRSSQLSKARLKPKRGTPSPWGFPFRVELQ